MPSPGAQGKAATRRTSDGMPVHSFRTLLDDLSTIVVNTVRLPGTEQARVAIVTRLTTLQGRALALLDVKPDQAVPMTETG